MSVRADRGRVAQALGNVLANAAEHGDGEITVLARRAESRVLVSVANERGRGLKIAGDAAREARGADAVLVKELRRVPLEELCSVDLDLARIARPRLRSAVARAAQIRAGDGTPG
jgi:signal transduction histidine kinase